MNNQMTKLLQDKDQTFELFEYQLYLAKAPDSPIQSLEWQEVIAEILLTIGDGKCEIWTTEGVVIKTTHTYIEIKNAITTLQEKAGTRYKWIEELKVAKMGEIEQAKVGDLGG